MILFNVWNRLYNVNGVHKMVLFFKTTTSDLYDVSRLMLSPIVTQPAAQQQHRVCLVVGFGGWGGFLPIIRFTPNSSWGWVGLWQLILQWFKSWISNILIYIYSKLKTIKSYQFYDMQGNLSWNWFLWRREFLYF